MTSVSRVPKPLRLLYVADLRYGLHAREGGNVHIRAMQRAFSEFMEVVEPPCPLGLGILRRVSRKGRPTGMGKLLQSLGLAIAMPEKLLAYLRLRPDLVYVRHEMLDVPLIAILRLFGARIALEVNGVVSEERAGIGPYRSWRRLLDLVAFHASQNVFTVSAYLKGRLVLAGVSPESITVTHNGIHLEDFPEGDHAFNRESPTIGFVGMGQAWHGLPSLIRAFDEIHRQYPQAHLLVVGPSTPEMDQEIATRGLGDRITIMGLIPHAEALAACERIDIAVMPNSNQHGSPLKIFEYMALSKTIVAANTPAIAEILDDGVSGLLVEPNSSPALAEAFRRLLADPDLAEKLARNARRRVVERFTWRGNALTVLERAGISPD